MLAKSILAENPRSPTGTTVIRVARAEDDVAMLRLLAGKLTSTRPDVVAVCSAPDSEGAQLIVVQRGSGASFDCGAWLKALAERTGGRGGGRPDRAEGRLPKDVDLLV